MVKEKDYLIGKLKEAGIKSQVYTSMKKLKQANEPHLGAVLRSGEKLSRSGSKRTFTDQEGQRKRRVKLWNRDTTLHVVIADTSEEKAEEILEKLLTSIGKGVAADGNWAKVAIGDMDWVEEGDSVLKAKIAVQFDVTFEGGIYIDRELKPVEVDTKEAAPVR